MRSVLHFAFLALFVGSALADDAGQLRAQVHWFAVPATEIDVCGQSPGVSTIRVDEPEGPYLMVHRIVADIVSIPETPYTLDTYRSVWLALEDYAKLRAKRRDAWLVTFSDGSAVLVRRK